MMNPLQRINNFADLSGLQTPVSEPVLTTKQKASENFVKSITHANLNAKIDELFSRVFSQMWEGHMVANRTKMLHFFLHNSANANLAEIMKNSFVNYLLKAGEITLKLGAAGLGLPEVTRPIGNLVEVGAKACEITSGLVNNNEGSGQTAARHDYDVNRNMEESLKDLSRKHMQQLEEMRQKQNQQKDGEHSLAMRIGSPS